MFIKFRFSSKTNGATAGLILTHDQFHANSITSLSRLFPMSEATKMERLEHSKPYDTWEEAFDHTF